MISINKVNPFYKLIGIVFLFFMLLFLIFELGFGIESSINSILFDLKNLNPVLIATGITLLLISDILLPIPSSLVMITSGVLLGGFPGGIVALGGGLLGSYINFEISRRLSKSERLNILKDAKYKDASLAFNKRAGLGIILSRIIPIVYETVNTVAGFSNISRKKFLIYATIGLAPTAFLYSFSGAYFSDSPTLWVIIIFAFVIPLIIWLLMTRYFNKST